MNMTNFTVLIKPDETKVDLITEICDDYNVGPNEPFAFSAIMTPDKTDKDYYKLKINSIIPIEDNPYTPTELCNLLYNAKISDNGVRYVQPPLEQWLDAFNPLLMTIINTVHPRYERLIPEFDEMVSIMYYTIVYLYRKGYYLHKTLIQKAYINSLNMEVRKLKNSDLVDSLDRTVGEDDDGKKLTLLDQICDPEATEWARQNTTYTQEDYWNDMYERIKSRMLQDMSELQFDRILIQLKTNTIDRSTSYKLDKYRQIFNPNYIPRPNAKGKPKGGNK
jgi:hypothetical protein